MFIRNSGEDDTVRIGNQWVLNARFNDARFFYNEDRKHSMDDFLERTSTIVFQEKLGTHSETNLGLNSGGGAKVNLIGPIRLRIDYRVFKLGDGALYSPAHRIYAGLNLKF